MLYLGYRVPLLPSDNRNGKVTLVAFVLIRCCHPMTTTPLRRPHARTAKRLNVPTQLYFFALALIADSSTRANWFSQSTNRLREGLNERLRLIFLEWELGGPELLRTIRADPELEELAIIYVTDEQPSRRKGDRARRDGVSGWAVRGVTGPQLYHLMRDLVRQQRGE